MRDAVRDEQGRVRRRFANQRMVGRRRVELRFAEVEGRIVCIGLEIGPPVKDEDGHPYFLQPDDDQGADMELDPLTTAEIRLPLRQLVDDSLIRAVKTLERGLDGEGKLGEFSRREMPSYRATVEKKKVGRPPKWTHEHVEGAARIYSEHVTAGGRSPTRAVADHFFPGDKSAAAKSRAAKLVSRARAGGLLPPFGGQNDDTRPRIG